MTEDRKTGTPNDIGALRKSLGCFLTGVTVVTTVDEEGRPRGIAANSFTSVSLDPPLVLVCISQAAASCDAFAKAPGFAVSVLKEDQRQVALKFASKDPDKFECVDWRWGRAGAPILSDSLCWLDCETDQRVVAGDHLVLIGRVVAHAYVPERPLGFFKGSFVDFGLERTEMENPRHGGLVVGCIVEHNTNLLLCRKKNETFWTPLLSGMLASAASKSRSLQQLLERFEVESDQMFIYSVFDLPQNETVCVIYRSTTSSIAADLKIDGVEIRSFPMEELPWEEIRTGPYFVVLSRYAKERLAAKFGIYAEYKGAGKVVEING